MFPGRVESRRAVPAIVHGLRQRGYRFVTVSELMEAR
jgi:peptidoglycan/xylan/chitin deacetylase (PgdA/CDA1 family)